MRAQWRGLVIALVVAANILRIGLAAYADMLAQYRVLFRIAVAIWVLSIAFDALQSEGSFRPTLFRFLRGAGLGIVEQGAGAALRKHLRDAAAHGACAGDAGDQIAAGDVEHGRGKPLF